MIFIDNNYYPTKQIFTVTNNTDKRKKRLNTRYVCVNGCKCLTRNENTLYFIRES